MQPVNIIKVEIVSITMSGINLFHMEKKQKSKLLTILSINREIELKIMW